MSMVPFHFARNLKISRFTIDVLMQRLDQLKPRRPEGCGGLLGKMNQSVRDCDHLHNDICDRFCGVQSFDAGSIAPLMTAFVELDRRITNAIASCNVFEFGPCIEASQ
jgi:hypothetical protein